MIRVRPPVAVSEQVVGSNGVVVRTAVYSRDRERGAIQNPGFENPLRAEQRDSDVVQSESFQEDGMR
jgi:hypothetical protein